jgi:hypothetical protein
MLAANFRAPPSNVCGRPTAGGCWYGPVRLLRHGLPARPVTGAEPVPTPIVRRPGTWRRLYPGPGDGVVAGSAPLLWASGGRLGRRDGGRGRLLDPAASAGIGRRSSRSTSSRNRTDAYEPTWQLEGLALTTTPGAPSSSRVFERSRPPERQRRSRPRDRRGHRPGPAWRPSASPRGATTGRLVRELRTRRHLVRADRLDGRRDMGRRQPSSARTTKPSCAVAAGARSC